MELWLQEVVANMDQMFMIAPILLAALISGGSAIAGSLINRSGQKEPSRIKDPMRDPLTDMLSEYYQSRVGQSRPGYEGELSAPMNDVLLQLISSLTGQSDQYGGTINDLVARFSSPSGAQGWNPVSAGWNRYPGGQHPGNRPSPGGRNAPPQTGGLSPEIAQFVAARMGMGG